MNIDAIIGNQQQLLFSKRYGLFRNTDFLYGLGSALSKMSAKVADSSTQSNLQINLQPAGTHEFAQREQIIKVGETGVTVRVSDLVLTEKENSVISGGKMYVAPFFSKAASATITGTTSNDSISVTQDASGNTILTVGAGGQSMKLDLGKIAAVNISTGEGNDTIRIDAKNYFGGITISGGNGDDIINVKSSVSLSRGVSVEGDAGDDEITLAGNTSALSLRGGAGDDLIDARAVESANGFLRYFYGDDGQDKIYGTAGTDLVYGGAGNDLILGGMGDDTLHGEEGDDTIYGDEGDDLIYGNGGIDALHGGSGSDTINGGDGDDLIMGDGSGDILRGGSGNDYIYGGSPYLLTPYNITGQVHIAELFSFISGGEGIDTIAPSSLSPWKIVSYSGSGGHLLDYDPEVDILV